MPHRNEFDQVPGTPTQCPDTLEPTRIPPCPPYERYYGGVRGPSNGAFSDSPTQPPPDYEYTEDRSPPTHNPHPSNEMRNTSRQQRNERAKKSLPPVRAIKKNKGKGNSGPASSRGTGFTRKEVDFFLDLIGELLPLCQEEWDEVHKKHTDAFPLENRTVDSLKRKFASLHRKKMPTGDPSIPEEIRRAKEVRYRMTERADIGDGVDAEEIANEMFPAEEADHENTEVTTETPQKDSGATLIDLSGSLGTARASIARPIVRRRLNQQAAETSSFNEVLKMMMVQDQQRRDDEAIRREEDSRYERERREQESLRNQRFMEMVMLMVSSNMRPMRKQCE